MLLNFQKHTKLEILSRNAYFVQGFTEDMSFNFRLCV